MVVNNIMEDDFEDFYQCCKSGNIEEVKKYISIGENIPKDIITFIDELLTNPLKCQGN